MADDATDRTLASHQDGFDIAAILVRDQIGGEARSAWKMNRLDVVAGVVEQIVRVAVAGIEIRLDQPEVCLAETGQKVVERAILPLLLWGHGAPSWIRT